MTTLAEAVVQQAFEMSIEKVAERRGLPAEAPSAWAIMALGKFGGRDMGFGSDIEIIFVYESEGQADERGTVNNSTFFEEAAREFLKTIETREHGVFEIDLRGEEAEPAARAPSRRRPGREKEDHRHALHEVTLSGTTPDSLRRVCTGSSRNTT